MNALSVSGYVTGFSCLFLAVFILRYGTNKVQKSFAFQNIAISLWGFGNGFAGMSKTPGEALLCWKMASVGGFFIMPLLLNHVLILNNRSQKKLLTLVSIWAALYPVACFFGLDGMQVKYVFNSFYIQQQVNVFYIVYYAIWIVVALYVSLLSIKGYLTSYAEQRKAMLLYTITYLGGIWGGATYIFMVALNLNLLYPYGNYLILLYCVTVTYSILRHKLFDIEIIIRKTLVFAGIFAGVYGIFSLIVFLIPSVKIPNFQMAWAVFTFSSLMTGLTGLVSVFILVKYGSKRAHYILATFNLVGTVLWGFGAFLVGIAKDSITAMFFWKIALIGAIFAPVIFYHVIVVVGELRRKALVTFFYIFGFIFYILAFLDLAGIKIITIFNSLYYIRATDFRWFALISIWVVAACCSLVETYRLCKKTSGYKRTQFQYLMVGATIGWTGAFIVIMPFFGINAFPVGNVLVWLYCIIVTYAIIRHQFMDISVAIKKTVVFAGIFVCVYALFTVVTFYGPLLITNNKIMTLIPSLLVVVIMYKPMERLLINITDRYLFQKKYDYKELLKVFTEEVLTVLDLGKLVNITVDKLVDIMRVSSCAVLLLNREKDAFYVAAAHNIKNEEQVFSSSTEEVKKKLGVELVMPMVLNDKFIGLIALGRKKSDESYIKDDIDILQSLARTLAIAISNAQLFDELGKTQAESAQKAKMAVIGTLAAGMAHEIRNPITTIKTFAEYFKEKKDDPDFIEKFQKLVPREVEKINDMITNLLEFSKPADYKSIEPVDLKETLGEVLELLETEMAINDIVLKEDIAIVPLISGNKKYIQEVFFNLIQNAMHAIGRRGDIFIDAVESGKYVDVTIKDTGCGITEENIKHVFEPFFTTKMTATGVGLGLYVIKQLMTRMDGSISVESHVGTGTTFHLRFNKAGQ